MTIARIGMHTYDLGTPVGRYGAAWAALKALNAGPDAFARAEQAWRALGSPWFAHYA